tara:strand:+ start:136 stop:846 length:711 start_codon:yes stop_codon:yes gene_type:complete
MKILVFDTETTGLPEKDASIYDFEKWPHIIQISAILYDLSTNHMTIQNNYIKIDDSIDIPLESYEIHHLNHEFLNKNGIHIIPAMREFNNLLYKSDIVIGHNIAFDKKLVFVECLRHKIRQYFTQFNGRQQIRKAEYCTMKKSTNVCKLSAISKRTGKLFRKTPSLIELYTFLFPESEIPKDLHNSLVDILITFRCYMKLEHNIDIIKINEKTKKLFIEYNCISNSLQDNSSEIIV